MHTLSVCSQKNINRMTMSNINGFACREERNAPVKKGVQEGVALNSSMMRPRSHFSALSFSVLWSQAR